MSLIVSDNIYDKFVMNNIEYVVLNNRLSANEELNKKLLIGQVNIGGDNIKEIIPIRDDEMYDEILEYYLTLKSAFEKGDIQWANLQTTLIL